MPKPGEIDLNWAHTYWTHEEIFGHRFDESEMRVALGEMAVEDCLEALSRLSCMVEGASVIEASRQLQIMRRMGFAAEIVAELNDLFRAREGGRPRVLFFPQQVVHLTRFALRYADRRPGDKFDNGRLAGSFIRCLFGVTDLLGPEIVAGSRAEIRGLLLRQLGMMSRQETLYLFSRYYELLVRLWPKVHPDAGGFAPAIAFEQFTGMGLDEFFVLGFAVYTRFLNHVDQDSEPQDFALDPPRYFETTQLREEQWQTFLRLLSRTPDQLRDALAKEDERYGPGVYRCHTFDRVPLVETSNGFMPTSFASLERAVTEGAFWLLADAAEAQGLPREEFTSPFGKVFERFAQESLERIAAMEKPAPRLYRDFDYGPKRSRVLSSDVSLIYEHEGIFFEVVTGRPSVATTTRGNEVAFREDLRKLVLTKAAQLRRCWQDFFLYGRLQFDDVGRGRIHNVWPVLILIEGFPLMPPIYGEVVELLGSDGWPRNAPRLTLLDADELGALEAMVEQGWTTLQVLQRWKRQGPELPMSNWLAKSPDVGDDLGHATWHKQSFGELTELVTQTVFGKSWPELEADREGHGNE